LSAAAELWTQPGSRALRIGLRDLENRMLWLLVASSFVAFVEPSPYEFLFAACLPVFLAARLRITTPLLPALLLLIGYAMAAALAIIPYFDEPRAVQYAMTSIYLSFSTVVFAAIFAQDPAGRLKAVTSGWILAALVASVLGLLGYFDVAGTGSLFSLNFRASGTFKDPNVFGPFVAVPALLLIQRMLTGTSRHPIIDLGVLLVLLGGVFFSFSRGAWGITVFGAAMCALLTLATTDSWRTRLRIVVLGTLGAVLLASLLGAVVSIDGVADIFQDRATLLKEYDQGPKGRFGQIPGLIIWLLDHPEGWGPLMTEVRLITAPHNQFVSAFGNFGWFGGFAYLALMGATCFVGFRTVFIRTSWQNVYIAYWSIAFMQILQGLQIDTNNWRHFWLLIGIVWGCAAAARASDAARPARRGAPLAPRTGLPPGLIPTKRSGVGV
jgi:hypothetical protein